MQLRLSRLSRLVVMSRGQALLAFLAKGAKAEMQQFPAMQKLRLKPLQSHRRPERLHLRFPCPGSIC